MSAISHVRIKHAAHYAQPGTGHDLDQWTVTGDVERGTRTGRPMPPPGVPIEAEYHSGFVRDGVQHHVFTRKAAFGEGTCKWCEGMVSL